MTHDELLIELNRRLEAALYNGDPQSIHAIYAVVELHKPKLHHNDNVMYCIQCSSYCYRYLAYPCPTIQAIDKAVNG